MGGLTDGTLLDYVLGIAPGKRLLYVPTAGMEDPARTVSWYERLHGRAEMTHLHFSPWPPAHLRELVLGQDIVLVTGGNTANALAIWRVHGFDTVLREAWERGIVLTGWSAGMICWFEHGVTDSFGPELAVDGVPRISARQRLPALRRRGAPPAGVHSSSSERVCRQASQRTTTSRSTSSAPSCTRSSLRGPARPPTGSGPKASDHSRRGCSAERRAASSVGRPTPASMLLEPPSISTVAASARAELREPRKPSQAQPDGREQDVEDEQRQAEQHPPDGPAPPGDGRLCRHVPSAAAASAFRPSTVRRIRCAVSSIESSEMSITDNRAGAGPPSPPRARRTPRSARSRAGCWRRGFSLGHAESPQAGRHGS